MHVNTNAQTGKKIVPEGGSRNVGCAVWGWGLRNSPLGLGLLPLSPSLLRTPPPCPSSKSYPVSSPRTFLTTSRSSKYQAQANQEQPVRFAKSGHSCQTYTLFSRGIPAIYRNAVFPELVRPQPGESALTILEIFLSGMATGADRPCLGWRPRISSNPLKFANKYEWMSYAEVNERRLNLGSAIEALFRSGRAGGGELPTVGIWCQNRPGAFSLLLSLKIRKTLGAYLFLNIIGVVELALLLPCIRLVGLPTSNFDSQLTSRRRISLQVPRNFRVCR